MFKGIPASPGVAIGKAFILEEEDSIPKKKSIKKEEIKSEISRFKKAVELAKDEFEENKEKILKELGTKHTKLFDAYILIIEDPLLKDAVINSITKENINAEYSLYEATTKIAATFERVEDEYLRERGRDITDAGRKILRHLTGTERKTLKDFEEDVIVIAHSISPSDTISMREKRIVGFATDVGGKTSHTAIMAQSLEIPAVVGLKDITKNVSMGDTIIIDGNQGMVIVNPPQSTIENYKRERFIFVTRQRELEQLRNLPAETLDGHKVSLVANIEMLDDIKSVLAHGAEGVGLFRTEYLYLNRTDLPSEDEQFNSYKFVAESMLPNSVIVRTIDVGADKFSDYLRINQERNPFLGLRAIRFCLKYPDIFKVQLRAILRASTFGKLKVMYPMISGIDELRAANKIFNETKEELRTQNIVFDEKIECGVMIEIPSAALTADLLAKESDFLSIGTNDLIQYMLAVDRINENVTYLYEPLHISVIRLLKSIIDAGHKMGKWVGMCGEMASDIDFTMILLGLGLDEFSVAPIYIPPIKKIIRSTTIKECKALADEIILLTDRSDMEKLIKRSSKTRTEDV